MASNLLSAAICRPCEAASGIDLLRAGACQVASGIELLRAGACEAASGIDLLRAGACEVAPGQGVAAGVSIRCTIMRHGGLCGQETPL